MREIMAAAMVRVASALERIDVLLREWEDPTHKHQQVFAPTNPVDAGLRHHFAKSFDRVAEAAEILGAPLTRLAAERAGKLVMRRKEPMTWAQLKAANAEIFSRFEDETGEVKLYCLAAGASAYYSPGEPLFGKQVEARIPKSADDISEAGKCFATARYTASVFHLMRAMEAAVQKISEELEIANVEREWGKLLSDTHKKIEPMPKGEERDRWSQVHANLYHVKQAWRNDTMHPKATYTEEEAREVFDATRAFMRHLAAMLPPGLEEVS